MTSTSGLSEVVEDGILHAQETGPEKQRKETELCDQEGRSELDHRPLKWNQGSPASQTTLEASQTEVRKVARGSHAPTSFSDCGGAWRRVTAASVTAFCGQVDLEVLRWIPALL